MVTQGAMESMYAQLALYRSKNECARTDNVFSPISEVCDGWFPVELYGHKKMGYRPNYVAIPYMVTNTNNVRSISLEMLVKLCKTDLLKIYRHFHW